MHILFVGDIVGQPGREIFAKLIGGLKEEFRLDLVVVNAENSAGGSGVTARVADQLFASGADVLTLGDHVWDKSDVYNYLQQTPHIIRPANFPTGAPGRGWCVIEKKGFKIGVINLLGRVFMRYNVNCPFRELERIAAEIRQETPIILVDMHAETTSEKVAIGFFMDGRVSAIVGTHTHIQTADEKILPQKTAYITDLGMTGPYNSVIGQNKEKIIQRFLTSMPHKFEVALEDARLSGAVIDVDEATGQARSITRIHRTS